MSASIEPVPTTLVFQSAKLGDIRPHLLGEIRRARTLLEETPAIGRIFGVSGGALVALAAACELAARRFPDRWGRGGRALDDLAAFLESARSRDLRRPAFPPWYGFYRLDPLRAWLAARLRDYAGRDDVRLSDLGIPLYLCPMDEEGILTLLGLPDDSLQCPYHAVHVGPPRDAPIVDAAIAAVSTLLSTVPALVRTGDGREAWLRDARPAIVDAGAIVADLEAAEPRPIVRTIPHAPVRRWPLNWFTSSFIMHSQNERNQTLMAGLYLDLLDRQRRLLRRVRNSRAPTARGAGPAVYHVDLPYVGSTEAFTNMRQSTENKDALMARFEQLLDGQLDNVRFDQPVNIIYGAGGFSGILGGLVTTRHVETAIREAGGEVRQVYGVSAGVLNGFFHAVQIAARVHPGLYRPAAAAALEDLEGFIAGVSPKKIGRINLNPARLWQGWANLGPLEEFLLERMAAYTGSTDPASVTFDDVCLPLTVACARGDGFTDFLGPSDPARAFRLGGRTWRPINGPVVRSMIAGWSMNTYVEPARMHGQDYRDGGGTFYDPGVWIACMDDRLSSLLNIHLDEPEGHSYHLPARPDLLRIVFDTHNYIFPEERRRMRLLTDLLYEHYALRREAAAAGLPIEDDFRQAWTVPG